MFDNGFKSVGFFFVFFGLKNCLGDISVKNIFCWSLHLKIILIFFKMLCFKLFVNGSKKCVCFFFFFF
jgi:hypothetical protein